MSTEVQEQSANYNLADLKPVIEKASGNNTLLDSLPTWLSAQTAKSAGRGRSVDNTHQYGVQKLRELILELAVRGKLVEQDPGDEHANTLLEKIAEEKARLVKAGKVKKPRELASPSDNDIPYSLPNGWKWTQIENIGHDWGQETPSEDFTYIDVASIDNARGEISKPSVLSPSDAPSRARRIVKSNTVIYSTIRPYLQNIAVILEDIEPKPIASTAFAIVHPLLGMSARYFLHYFRSPTFVKYVESIQTGIAYPAINDKQFFAGLAPVPPLAEQYRIVKKVDELMALCDKLEQQQADAVQAHDTLVKVLLDTLTQSDNADDFQQNWRRIAEHFDTLFTTESSIDQLKQTLLQLAVMGKLVPQAPNDEPASVLLQRIAEEKAQLVKEGKIKKQKPLPEITSKDLLFSPPEAWAMVRLGEICVIERGGSPRPIKAFLTNEPDGLNWIKIGDTEIGGKYISNTAEKITKEGLHKTRMVYPGDFLLTNSMSFGRPYITKIEGCIHDGWLRISPPSDIDKDYLYLLLSSSYIRNFFIAAAAGAVVQNLNSDKVRELPLPLPSITEQHRIVKKVDELMALCDQLKDRLNQAQTLQQQLADTVVKTTI